MERTGAGDPIRVLPLLWRKGLHTSRSGLSLDEVLTAATELADSVGIERLSMRKLADKLGIGTMTLYSHVPGKSELIDLLVDHAYAAMSEQSHPDRSDWRQGLNDVAAANWALYEAHPWLLDVDTTRPALGPGTMAKYEAELQPLAQTGLSEVEIDQVLSLVLEHVRASARQSRSLRQAGTQSADADWWREAGPLLAAFVDADQFPLASRVGEAAGLEYGAASDPDRAYAFGLRTILNGVAALIEGR